MYHAAYFERGKLIFRIVPLNGYKSFRFIFGLRNSSVTSNNCSPRFFKFHIDGTSYQKCYSYASKNRASNQNRFTFVKSLIIWRFTLWRDCVLHIDGSFFSPTNLFSVLLAFSKADTNIMELMESVCFNWDKYSKTVERFATNDSSKTCSYYVYCSIGEFTNFDAEVSVVVNGCSQFFVVPNVVGFLKGVVFIVARGLVLSFSTAVWWRPNFRTVPFVDIS